MEKVLPDKIAAGSALRGDEYAWRIAAFPKSLQNAQSLGYACLGGQFQFIENEGTYEMYWLDADSTERFPNESWNLYCERSCLEVGAKFEQRVINTDFVKEAENWPGLHKAIENAPNLDDLLVFVGYFVDESEWLALTDRSGLHS